MTENQRASGSSAYGRALCTLDDVCMLWFDWQRESTGASAECTRVGGANERAARLFGAGSAAQLRGRSLEQLFGARSWSELEGELARTGESAPRTLALEWRGASGESVRARARLFALGAARAEGRPTLLLLEEQDEAAENEHEGAQPSELVCARLADGLLHDLRSPLMAISGFAEVLGFRHAAELGEDARRCVENIAAAARRLEQMTDLLGSYSRLGAGELKLRPLDLRPLLQALAAEPREAPLELELADGPPLVVAGDAGVLREVLSALLGEAQHVAVSHAPGSARIEIGGFETPLPEVELALARRALELHGGSLRCERRAAGELAFVLELPALAGP